MQEAPLGALFSNPCGIHPVPTIKLRAKAAKASDDDANATFRVRTLKRSHCQSTYDKSAPITVLIRALNVVYYVTFGNHLMDEYHGWVVRAFQTKI